MIVAFSWFVPAWWSLGVGEDTSTPAGNAQCGTAAHPYYFRAADADSSACAAAVRDRRIEAVVPAVLFAVIAAVALTLRRLWVLVAVASVAGIVAMVAFVDIFFSWSQSYP